MYIQQLYTNCLAEAAYYIESNGEAAIIDPIRETEQYVVLAKSRGAKIKYVFETHFHADFVSGHIDLARQTGATIIFGPLADTTYKTYSAKDGEEFKIGDITIRTLHTPGHTPESTCYLLLDPNGMEYCIFTGDTLFVGDVGRPDLLDGKMTKEELAGMMYDSLNKKIKVLPDNVLVYPAHGPGSSCGKNIGKETWSSIGQQKKTNYALADMTRQQFIDVVTDGLAAPPAYFFKDAAINKHGYNSLDDVMKKNVRSLTLAEFEKALSENALVLDTRIADDFEKGFIAGSVNVGLNGNYAIWVGTLIDINTPLILVCDSGKEEESILRLARVGFENVMGYLNGGFSTWASAGKPVDTIVSIEATEFADNLMSESSPVLDVRKITEAENGHVKDATVIPLADLKNNLPQMDKDGIIYVHCARGYRSMIASSILKASGYKKIVNVRHGWNKIRETTIPIETGRPANLVNS
jgi:hydroxyacylglutathione hydrolase